MPHTKIQITLSQAGVHEMLLMSFQSSQRSSGQQPCLVFRRSRFQILGRSPVTFRTCYHFLRSLQTNTEITFLIQVTVAFEHIHCNHSLFAIILSPDAVQPQIRITSLNKSLTKPNSVLPRLSGKVLRYISSSQTPSQTERQTQNGVTRNRGK